MQTQIEWGRRRLDWLAVLDILIVAAIIYSLLTLLRGTQAVPLLRGVLILTVVIIALGWLFSNLLELKAVGWFLRGSTTLLAIAIPVIFQPELRQMLERPGDVGPSARRWEGPGSKGA